MILTTVVYLLMVTSIPLLCAYLYVNKHDHKEEKVITKISDSLVKDIEIIHDNEKGHMIQATVVDRKKYLTHDGFSEMSDAQEYLDKCKAKVRKHQNKNFMLNQIGITYYWENEKVNYTNTNFYNHYHYLTLDNKRKKINKPIHEIVFSHGCNYVSSLSQVSRYSDEDLVELNELVDLINFKQKYDKPLEELLSLSTVNASDKEREYFFNQISIKLELQS
jgi:hypothetical protein